MNEEATTCAVCGRAVYKADVNTSGQCSECAGQHVEVEPERETPQQAVQKVADGEE